MREHLERLVRHLAWADARILRLLNDSPGARRPEVMRLYSHVLGAERVWLLRTQGADAAGQPVWPSLALVEMNAMAAANAVGYTRLLAQADPGAEVAYTNTQGAAFRTRVDDILLHVAMHGAYHRGQIAAALRAAGEEPVNTDYITFVREQAPASLHLTN